MATPIITLAEYRLGLEKLNSEFDLVKKKLKDLEDFADKSGKKFSDNYGKGIVNDLKQRLNDLAVARDRSFNPIAVERFNAKILETQQKLDKLTESAKKHNEEINRLEQTFRRIGERIVAAFAIERVIEFAKESVNLYNESVQGETKLLNALKGRTDIQERLIDQAKELQSKTLIDKDAIISQQAFLAAQGRTEAQIKKTVAAAIQLAAVTGHDLASEIQRLDGTMEGSLKGLNRLDAGFKKLSVEQLQNGAAIDLVAKKYQGFAEAAAQAGTGPFTILKNKFKENVMEPIGEFITNIATAGLAFASFVSNGFKVPQTLDQIREEAGLSADEIKRLREEMEKVSGLIAGTFGGEFARLTDGQLQKYIDQLQKEIIPAEIKHADLLGKSTTPLLEKYNKLLQDANKELADRNANQKAEEQTLENLNKKLQTYQNALQTQIIGSKEYLATQKKILDLEAEIEKAKGKNAKEILAAQKEANTDLIALSGETQKALASSEQDGLQKRQDALEADRIATQKKNEERLKKDLDAYKGNAEKQAEIKKAFNENSLALDNALARAQDNLRREQADKDIQAEGERQKRNTENLLADFKESQELLGRVGDAKKTKLDQQFAAGEISQKEYNRKIREINLQTLNDQLADAERRGQDTTEIKKKIAETEIQIAKDKKDKIKEIEQELADAIKNVADGLLDLQRSKRDAELSDLEKNFSDQQKALDEQLSKKQISQKNYDKKKAELAKKAQEEENALKRKNDKADQQAAVFKVAIATAEAVALDILSANYVKAGIDAAVGAAQIAIIEATPLPKYAKGTLRVLGGEAGKDSVPALLMPDEAVIPAKQAIRHTKALAAIMDGQFDNYVLKSYLPRLLSAEKKASGSVAEKMVLSAQFNDKRIVRAIKESHTDTASVVDAIKELGSKLESSTRTSKLYKRYGR